MKLQAVIFDLDGTLLNTIDDLADSMNRVLEVFGRQTHSPEDYKLFVGEGIDRLIAKSLNGHASSSEDKEKMIAMMKKEYSERWKMKTLPYPGIPEMLKQLSERKMNLSVLSNKPHEFTQIMVRYFFPDINFQTVSGARPDLPKKPDPSGAAAISRQSAIPAENFIFIGDSGVDMITAKNAGMKPAGALWGFRPKEELLENGAEILLSRPMELLDYL